MCTRKAEASSVASYKEPQTRTYDKDGFRLRAGCVCVRTKRSEVKDRLLMLCAALTTTWAHLTASHP